MGRKSEQNGTVYLRKWKTNRELKGNNDDTAPDEAH